MYVQVQNMLSVRTHDYNASNCIKTNGSEIYSIALLSFGTSVYFLNRHVSKHIKLNYTWIFKNMQPPSFIFYFTCAMTVSWSQEQTQSNKNYVSDILSWWGSFPSRHRSLDV